MRIGVLGGTFDPPHIGHLIAAVDAYESLKLDRLIFIPTAAQPHKAATPAMASAADRMEMLRLAVGTDPRFEVNDAEIQRGGLSYTVDTLETLRREHPDAELVLIVGMDALAAFDRWKNPDRILELAGLAVVARNGDPTTSAPVDRHVTVVGARQVDVSSTEIRKRLSDGKSVRGFVAESVEAYIAARNLYGKG
ncbi:MAG TPA: nicotinate-nucleotide adenylyltransferase [Gemmatimonadaceae bacterium]|nr:nicotinate-nucleotide adenylyltransferase [Gemmatimonadaceae bacterium]